MCVACCICVYERTSFYFCRRPEESNCRYFQPWVPVCSRIINRTTNNCIIMSIRIFYVISANRKQAGKTHLSYPISFRFGTRQIYFEAGKQLSGLDGRSNQWLKWSLSYIIDSLTYSFNLDNENFLFHLSQNPKVVPLPKSKDKTNPTHYRPISFLSVLSKLLEKNVHIHLNDYLEKRRSITLFSLV